MLLLLGAALAREGYNVYIPLLRESSFNMARGDEDIEGVSENF